MYHVERFGWEDLVNLKCVSGASRQNITQEICSPITGTYPAIWGLRLVDVRAAKKLVERKPCTPVPRVVLRVRESLNNR